MYTPLVATDSAFDAENSGALHLSIQSDLSGLCFCVLDLERRTYVAFKSIPYAAPIVDYNDMQPALSELLAGEQLLAARFSSVSYLYASRHATIIPSAMLDGNLLKSFLELNNPINDLDEVHSSHIPQLNAAVAFAVPSPFAATLLEKYGSVKFYHQSVPMLKYLQEHVSMYSSENLFAVNISCGFADVALYAGGTLKIYNTFTLHAPEDLAYFMLAIARRQQISEKKTSVLLSGDIEPYIQDFPSLFHSLIPAIPHTQMSFACELSDVAGYRFSHLFSLYECA
ncbi:MAG: DUF3822 family protein [Prevotellaceae bacterium]|jgi:hypothetical protein|nr:DUF3822 family protein [Prevotellaceae bacterium]